MPVLKPGSRFGIGRKLLSAILLTSSIITLFAIGAQLVAQYEQESRLLHRNLHQYFNSTMPSLAQALWDADLALVRRQMDGALNIPGVKGLVLTSIEGYVVKSGDTQTTPDETWQLPLVHQGRHIGSLKLDISRRAVRQRMRNSLTVIIITQAIKTFMMSVIILWLTYHLVTRHLVRASRQLANYARHPHQQPLNLGRRGHVRDELDMLEDAFNGLYHRLQSAMHETLVLNERLQHQSSELESAVNRKTRTLQRQYRAADLLTQLSIELLQMADERREKEMPALLGRAASAYEIQALAFYRFHDGHYRPVHSWPDPTPALFRLPEALPDGGTCLAQPAAGLDETFFPAVLQGGFAGVLALEHPRDSEDAAVRGFFFSQLARVLLIVDQRAEYEQRMRAMNEQLTAANADLQTQAETDALTGILNRRPFNRALDRAIRAAVRQQQALGLLVVDIDHFKSYNDHFGHLQGDRALIQVAKRLQSHFQRATDLVARFGGEEFVVLMTHVEYDQFGILAEAFRMAIWDEAIDHPGTRYERLTVSIGGYWCLPDTHFAPATLIRIADQALYRAKSEGRNRLCIAPTSSSPAA